MATNADTVEGNRIDAQQTDLRGLDRLPTSVGSWTSEHLAVATLCPPLPDRLSPLEAIAWIASGDAAWVGSIAGRPADAFDLLRTGGFEVRHINLYFHGWTVATAEIKACYCACGEPHVDKGALRLWNGLSEQKRELGRSGEDPNLEWIFKCAHERHCICFTLAERQLFRAASSGEIVARGILNGLPLPVPRSEWMGRVYDDSKGVVFDTPGWTAVEFETAHIQRRFPSQRAASVEVRRPGRPSVEAAPLRIYDARRAQGIPVASSRIAEMRLCVAEATQSGFVCGEPKTYAEIYSAKYQRDRRQKL